VTGFKNDSIMVFALTQIYFPPPVGGGNTIIGFLNQFLYYSSKICYLYSEVLHYWRADPPFGGELG
jgi:hypothetical protein